MCLLDIYFCENDWKCIKYKTNFYYGTNPKGKISFGSQSNLYTVVFFVFCRKDSGLIKSSIYYHMGIQMLFI